MSTTVKKVLFSLTAIAIPLALVFLGCELALRWLEPPPLLDKGRVVRKSTNPGKQYELLPGAHGAIAGAPVSIDSFGCRDREYALAKPGGTVRIVGVGDSLTFGQGVTEEATYLARLETSLSARSLPVEVINCGVFGYNADEEAARFAEVAAELNPDIIVVGYELGDILRNPPPRQEALGAGQGPPREPPRMRSIYNVLRHSRVVTFLAYRFSFLMKKFALRDWDGLYADGSPLWEHLVSRYQTMADVARERNIDVAVAIIPELSNLDAHYPFRGVHARVAEMCRSRGMKVIDLLPAFLGQDGPSLWVHPQDRHPNARGHEIIAGGLIDEVAAQVAQRTARSAR